MIDRRKFLIRSIGAAICAGAVPTFLPSLLPDAPFEYFGIPLVADPYCPEDSMYLINNTWGTFSWGADEFGDNKQRLVVSVKNYAKLKSEATWLK